MSWPSDGEPRYVVASINGGEIQLRESVFRRSYPEWYVHDRAYCHRVVFSTTRGDRKAHPFTTAEQVTRVKCAELNAEQGRRRAA